MSPTAETAPRLSAGTTLAFAIGALPVSGMNTVMAISYQPYLAQTLGVGLVTIALAFFWVRVLDVGVDPVLAIIMDRTRTPLGRYRAWLLAGVPILMLGTYELFTAPKGVGIGYLIVWVLVQALGLSILTLCRSAWSANLVTRYDQRSRFYGYIGFFSVVGVAIALSTPFVREQLGPKWPNGVQLTGFTLLALIPVCTLVTGFVGEPISRSIVGRGVALREYWTLATKPEVLRLFFSQVALSLGPGWMGNLYLFFFVAARGFTVGTALFLLLIYFLAGLIGSPLIGLAGGRFGKHRTLIGATLCYSLGLCMVMVVPKADFWLTLPVMLWCGFMANGFDLMTSAMMADVGDQVRLEQGKERMALLFAFIGLAQKLAGAAAVIIAYPLLAYIGYQPTLAGHNSPATLRGLEIVFIVGPIFWVVLGGLCFIGWKLDATRHAEIRAELEARDAMLAQPTVLGDAPGGGIA